MFDWNDLRYLLAVAESGSTLGAGRALRVSQTTVARRIAALESALSVQLFERRQAGYVLTAIGEELIGPARQVERAAAAFAEAGAAQARDIGGTVRLSMSEIHAMTALTPLLGAFQQLHPAIRIEVDTTDEVRDLAGGGADVALRVSTNPEGGGLVGRRIATDDWAVYCSLGYAEAHGCPHKIADLAGHGFIGGGGETIWRYYREWLAAHDLEAQVTMHQGSVTGLLAAVRAGVGIAALPCFVADHEPDLHRCLPPAPGEERGIWLLTHERLRHVPRVRAVMDFLGDRLARRAAGSLADRPLQAHQGLVQR